MNKTPVAKTVDEYLNELSYTDLYTYKPSEFALQLVNVIKLIEGGRPENRTPVVHYKFIDTLVMEGNTTNLCHRGFAKALSLDSVLYTPKGATTIEHISIGDSIYGEDGKLTKVTHKSEVFNKPMYRLSLSDGRTLDVSEDHINVVMHKRQRRVKGVRVNYVDRRELTTKELLKLKLYGTRKATKKNPKGREHNVWIPCSSPMEFAQGNLEVDPYTLGLLLGDGCLTSSVRFCSHVDDMEFYTAKIPYELGVSNQKENMVVTGIKDISKHLRALGVMCHGDYKRVPKHYLMSSIDQRLELLRGLMDTRGTVYKNGACSFTSNSQGLVEDVMFLVRSLGGTASIGRMGKAWRTHVSCSYSIFHLPRKAIKQNTFCKSKIALESIELIPTVPSQCIAVDNSSKTFVANDFVVTHNTTVKEYLLWYIAIFGELPSLGAIPYALYISDSMDNGVKKMRRSMEGRWKASAFLQQYVPRAKFTDNIWDFTNASGNRFVVTGHGAQTGVRGTRENNSRPVLALLDDLISDTDAKSPTVIENVEDTVFKAVFAALHPTKRKIIWSGTPFNAGDPLYKAVESGAWNVNVFPVCETFPCDKKDFKGSWEDRFTYASVKEAYDLMSGSGKLEAFNQELMLRIMSDEDRVLDDSDIQWFERSKMIPHRERYNCYITTDIAVSASPKSDFMVISVWFHDHRGNWFYVDGICRQQLIDKTYDDLFRFVQIYKPMSVGIEVSGQQGMLIPLLQKEMNDRGIFFNLASESGKSALGIRPTSNKFIRFNSVVPWFKSRKIFFPIELKNGPAMQEAVNELSLVSKKGFKSKHDDFMDTISMLAAMNTFRPSQEVEYEYRESSGLWEEVDYESSVNHVYDNYLV